MPSRLPDPGTDPRARASDDLVPAPWDRRERWHYLKGLLDRADRHGLRSLSVLEVKQLGHLYRQVTVDLSQARTDGDDPDLVRFLNFLAARAHGRIYSTQRVDFWPLLTFITRGFPQTFRRCLRTVGLATLMFLLTSLASFLAVLHDPELAYSLFDENTVEMENVRLEKQSGEYRGNFTFSLSQSPLVAVAIIGNNVRVAILEFALGALFCLPGLMLLTYQGRMVGTLSGLLWNGGYFLGFYSLIMAHGVLELSALCIASAAGLVLGWALVSPGTLTRRDALKAAAGDSFRLLAGSALMLVVAGTIEAYVTPHCDAIIRWSVAATSGVLLALYLGLAGRAQSREAASGGPALTATP